LRGDVRPVDLVFLARQTGGDRALEEEVLRLFSKQAALLGNELRALRRCRFAQAQRTHAERALRAPSGPSRSPITRLQIETEPADPAPMTALLREVESVRDYIASLLR
jgi:hypothetical protein